jgi:hypothetical protein
MGLHMATQINSITGQEVNLLPLNSANTSPSGWIRLINGVHDAGYINLLSPTEKVFDPSLVQPPNLPPYIVIDMPVSALPVLLDILRNEGSLQIRYDDTGTAPAFAIIEPASPAPNAIGTPPAIAQALKQGR